MSKIRPVNVSFRLEENKIIPFTVIGNPNKMKLLSAQGQRETYSYAADIAFLNLCESELSKITIPVLNYSDIAKTKEFENWKNSINNMKSGAGKWENVVEPAIREFPENIEARKKSVQISLESVSDCIEDIVKFIKNGKEKDFNNRYKDLEHEMDQLQTRANNQINIFQDFVSKILNYSNDIVQQCDALSALSQQTTKLTGEQQKQVDAIISNIDKYEKQRKQYIAGACVTGTLLGGVIAGGITVAALVPGIGIAIGIACFFAGGALGAGMGICTARAIEIKKQIESLTQTKDNVFLEKAAIEIIGTQFSTWAAEVENLKASLQDILKNWKGVSDAATNIHNAVQKMKGKVGNVKSVEKWNDIQADVDSISAIVDTLNDTIETMQTKTEIYKNCNLSDCTTKEQIEEKLEEFVKHEREEKIS